MPKPANSPGTPGHRQASKPKHTNVDVIRKQRAKNPLLTIQDQATLNGLSKQAMSRLLQRHGINPTHMEEYKAHKADLLAGVQEMVLSHVDSDAIKRMVEKAPMAAVTLFNSCFNAERLERGQSTVNLAGVFARAMEQATPPQDVVSAPITVEAVAVSG